MFGLSLGNEIQVSSYLFTLSNKIPFLVLMGGEVTGEKLLALDTFYEYADDIVLLGKIGLLFYLY